MRNLKRVLSMALASVMVLGLTVVGASAADFNDQAEIKNTTAAAVMSAIGVLEGNEKGDFMPDQILTREQAAKIICYMLMGPENAEKLGASGTQFSDVAADRWSAPYIAYCANMGILAGDGTGKFNPEGELTGHAFAKMLLVALGYDATIQNYVGDAWAINVATDAVNAGVFVDGTVLSDALTRDNAAQMAFQTLEANTVTYSNKGTTITIGGAEIATGASAPTEGDTFMSKYFKDLEKAEDGSDDLGRPAVVWSYDDEEICKATDTADKTLAVDDAYDSYTEALQELLDNDKATIDEFAFNNDGETTADTETKIGDVMYVYKSTDEEGEVVKNEYDVYVAQYSFAIVDEIDTDVTSADEKDGVSSYVTLVDVDGDNTDVVSMNNTDFAGFAYEEGDAVAYITNAKGDKVIASYALESVEGAITAYKADDYVRVDGTKYELSGNVSGVTDNYDFDETYTLYLDANGYVLGIKGEAGVASLDEVYYVTMDYTESTTSYGVKTVYTYVQAIALDGTVSEILVGKKVGDDGDQIGAADNATAAGLYTFSKNSKDSKVSDPKAYNTDAAKDYVVFDGTSITTSGKEDKDFGFTASTTRINGADARAYINKNTKFVVVEASGDDLTVKTYTGSVRMSVDSVKVIADKNNNALYAILVADESTGTVAEADDLMYIAKIGAKVADGYEALAYDMNGKEIEGVVVDESVDAGLYTYAIDEDGIYTELDPKTGTAISDYEGYAVATTLDDLYLGYLLTFGTDYVDFDATDATIIDLRTSSEIEADVYDREITTLSRLGDAINDGDVTATLYVDDSVQVIFITACEDAPVVEE